MGRAGQPRIAVTGSAFRRAGGRVLQGKHAGKGGAVTDGRRRLAGRYRLDGSLGRGGMSEVFHGYDERLDRRVAIKLLRPPSASVPAGPDSPEAVEILDALERDRKRFLREIRTTAQLEHPGTPAVYDTGVDTALDGNMQLWLVMQLLRGSTLEAVLDRADYTAAPPSLVWAAAIEAQIAAVLADVHRVDIVHRDIKRANVMLVDGGPVKVLDQLPDETWFYPGHGDDSLGAERPHLGGWRDRGW